MSANSFLNFISVPIGIICLVLAFFLVSVSSDRRQANRFLAGFLVLVSIDTSGWLLAGSGLVGSWLNSVRITFGFLQMPFFLWFISASCFADFKLTKWDALHLLPFLAALALTLPGDQLAVFHPIDSPTPQAFLSARENTTISLGLHVQYYLYIAFAIWILIEFRRIFLRYYADVSSASFWWLSQFVAVSLVAHSFVLAKFLFALGLGSRAFVVLQIVVATLALGIVIWIALKALLQPEIFRKVDRAFLKVSKAAKANDMPESDLDAVSTRLHTHMTEAKPYLDGDLTLPGLADQLALTPQELSEVINRVFGSHFFDFVNQYRIAEAKELLRANEKRTILDVLHSVGFNSKSSFNSAFKKHTGQTPSEFRRGGSSSSD